MELYDRICYDASRRLTLAYSTSFGLSSKLFAASIRPHIYAVYGLVRIADEIVDTYDGDDQLAQLNALEAETAAAIERGYSVNPIVHSFARTAQANNFDPSHLQAFFASMRIDAQNNYTPDQYQPYIYGSAEAVGLMCLHVFCAGNEDEYARLKTGASALGAAYQKVNFLRDIHADYQQLHRSYFPGVTYETFSAANKQAIIADIKHDFATALPAIYGLPKSARGAVLTSYQYYTALLARLEKSSVEDIKLRRISVPLHRKLRVFMVAWLKKALNL